MSLQTLGKGALRIAKSYTKGYSHTQMKIRNATCNDPWPPSGKEMYELAQMTFNQNDFVEIMEVIDKRLNDKGKNWRHVFKSLVVLDYLLHSGSENVIRYCEDNLYEIKTLREFQYIDEDGKDQGANVRQKAKDITNLLMDKDRLHRERRVRSQMRDRMLGRRYGSIDGEDENQRRRDLPNGSGRALDDEEEQLRRAIEESKRTAAERATAEDKDLERAIRLSQEEEEKRKHALDEANAASLFDDSNQQPPPLQTQPLVDATLPLQFATTGIQPQFTALQPQFTSIQPQFTSFNPYLQQAQQEAMQAEYLRQQAEWAAQQQLLAAQHTANPFQAQSPAPLVPLQTGFPQAAPQPLVPQTTSIGSNNPFIAPPSPPVSPTSSTLLPQRASTTEPVSFNLSGTYDNRPRPRERESAASAPPRALLQPFSTGSEPPRRLGGERDHARLASLFANYTGDGVDTFGNTGQLRFLATEYGRLAAQKTGATSPSQTKNPFLHPESTQPQPQPQPAEEKLIDL
ncbi:ENTH-domain-containing protein [Trametes coccinea BRFM310]|uniref:ENTH-domain-containing protein n=1 Tax=Trametes coccinea (strain BRFM310) TaxID=1353009 RepID=A0A1Y2IIX6_TRAC3|nr:ENTH-domain-containing protein [Trametes coccinea BRFM310]